MNSLSLANCFTIGHLGIYDAFRSVHLEEKNQLTSSVSPQGRAAIVWSLQSLSFYLDIFSEGQSATVYTWSMTISS